MDGAPAGEVAVAGAAAGFATAGGLDAPAAAAAAAGSTSSVKGGAGDPLVDDLLPDDVDELKDMVRRKRDVFGCVCVLHISRLWLNRIRVLVSHPPAGSTPKGALFLGRFWERGTYQMLLVLYPCIGRLRPVWHQVPGMLWSPRDARGGLNRRGRMANVSLLGLC